MKNKTIALLMIFALTSVLSVGYLSANTVVYTEEDPFVTNLVSGRKKNVVGEVSVWNDADYLYIKIVTIDDWELVKTHIHVDEGSDPIPVTRKGNPIPGHFEYPDEHDSEDPYTLAVEIDGLSEGDRVQIAIHAEISNCDQEESAWAEGCLSFWRNWAMRFNYEIQPVSEESVEE